MKDILYYLPYEGLQGLEIRYAQIMKLVYPLVHHHTLSGA